MYRALQYVMDDSAIRLQGALKKKYRVSIKESNENSNTFSSIRHCVAGALYNVFRLIFHEEEGHQLGAWLWRDS